MSESAPESEAKPELPKGVLRMRRLAGAVLLFERAWPAVAPALGLVCVFLCAALLDLPRHLPPEAHLIALVLFGLATLALLGMGLRRVRRPSAAEADRRLEADTGLRHQPLAVLQDRPATGGDALWALHVARAQAQITRLRLHKPRPMLAAIDRRALRALAVTALFACVFIAGPDAPALLRRAVSPGFTPPPAPPVPLLQAWITPPAFTGLAPIFLKAEGGSILAPVGSKLTASLTGGTGDPTLVLGPATTPFNRLDAGSFQIDQELTHDGRLTIRRAGHEAYGWDLTVLADLPPEVVFPEPPGPQRGNPPLARLPWQVHHAYGVASLQAELHLKARPTPPLILSIPLPGTTPKDAKGARTQDLTPNPWAGLPVTAQLIAKDAAGLEGRSAIATFTLPERRFTHPVARALMAIRKQLSLTPEQRDPAVAALDHLASLPDTWDDDTSGFLNLTAIENLLAHTQDDDAVPDAQSRMWELALHLEEGAGDRTAKALEAARQSLQELLDAEKRGETIDRNELDRRAKDLQQALQKRLDALSEQAKRDPSTDAFDPDAHPMDKQDMQRLAEQMRQAERNGDDKTAQDKLAELDKMMEALKQGRPERGQMTQRERERAQQRQKGQQQMTVLQDLVQREGGVLDRSQRRTPEAANRGRPDPFAEPPSPADNTAPRAQDRAVQLALRRAVGELMQQYGDLTGNVPPNLSEADTAMRDAAQALAANKDAQAADSAQRAIEALQKGGQSMRQQLAQQFGRGQDSGDDAGDEPGDEPGDEGQMGEGPNDGQGYGQDGTPNGSFGNQPGNPQNGQGRPGRRRLDRLGEQRDPLGRPRGAGTGGLDDSTEVQVPEQMEEARTRALQEELRRRDADRTRSQQELDYIERLLKQY
jgi:uncharacterized protein (TIGR02302 family)